MRCARCGAGAGGGGGACASGAGSGCGAGGAGGAGGVGNGSAPAPVARNKNMTNNLINDVEITLVVLLTSYIMGLLVIERICYYYHFS